MDAEKQVMLREIELQSAFVREHALPLVERLSAVLADHRVDAVSKLYVLGCGDSYCAGRAGRQSVSEHTGRECEACYALEFSSYLVDTLPADALVVGVSNSGMVTRTVEGVARARAKGAHTLGLTADSDSPLARAAAIPLVLASPPNIKEGPDGRKAVTPGTLTYSASLLGLCAAGVALGRRLGYLDEPAMRAAAGELQGLGDAMEATLQAVNEPVRALADSLAPDRRTVILGGGPNYATAYFAMAKWFEALGTPAHAAEMEEWAHEHYFITDARTDTYVIAPPGPSRTRALEQMRAAREMGSRVVGIGHHQDGTVRAASDAFIGIPADVPESLTPLLYKLPFEYLACHLAQARGTAFLGFDDPKRQQVNFRQIFESE